MINFTFIKITVPSEPSKPSYNWKRCSGRQEVELNGIRVDRNGKQFVVAGFFGNKAGPAFLNENSCTFFFASKFQILTSCDYLEKSDDICWISSKNGKIEVGAVMYRNIAFGRFEDKGEMKIGRIVNGGLIYNDGRKEKKSKFKVLRNMKL